MLPDRERAGKPDKRGQRNRSEHRKSNSDSTTSPSGPTCMQKITIHSIGDLAREVRALLDTPHK